jgi:hypothetical protein
MSETLSAINTSKSRRRSDPSRALRSVDVAPDVIAVRAYELFLERGAEHGRDLEDWLRAESELSGRIVES